MAGLYIHIPFCASRCIYCSFYSTTSSSLQDRYVDALCREMQLHHEQLPISTIYLGGGTPSQLSHTHLEKLFTYIYNRYDVSPQAEVTIECNPDDVVAGMFDGLPVNRVSMGAQTFSDDRLRFLRRRHTAEQVDRAVDTLRHDKIDNISLDLIFGFPEETLVDWKTDIEHTLRLCPEHISAYSLMYEENTPLFRLLEQGKIQEISEELSNDMYDMLTNRLTEAGYKHYEISNFAQHNRQSRHNSSYWHNIPYIGLGAAAHSYFLTKRQWNVADIHAYMQAIEAGHIPYEEEVIDENTRYNDLITTALRTREGINLNDLDMSRRQYLLSNAEEHIQRHLLAIDNDRLHLTYAGIKISNSVMSDLMWV